MNETELNIREEIIRTGMRMNELDIYNMSWIYEKYVYMNRTNKNWINVLDI